MWTLDWIRHLAPSEAKRKTPSDAPLRASKGVCSAVTQLSHLVLAEGVEPSSSAWQAEIVTVRPRQYGATARIRTVIPGLQNPSPAVERLGHGANGEIRTHYLVLTKDAYIRMYFEGLVLPVRFELTLDGISARSLYRWSRAALVGRHGFEPWSARLKVWYPRPLDDRPIGDPTGS